MKVNVYVTLKPGVLDPQGKAIHHALEGLGFGGVADVRAGRFIELDVADGTSDADLDAMCAKRAFVGNVGDRIEITFIVRTGIDAVSASPTDLVIHDDNTVFTGKRRSGRTDANARRFGTVVAKLR